MTSRAQLSLEGKMIISGLMRAYGVISHGSSKLDV